MTPSSAAASKVGMDPRDALLSTALGHAFLLWVPPQDLDPSTLAREILVATPMGAVAFLDPETARIRLRIGTEGCKTFERSPDGGLLARLLYNDTVVVHDPRNGEERVRFKALPFVKPPHSFLEWAEEWWDEDRCLRFAGANDRLVLAKGHRATELWSLEPAERIAQPSLDEEHATAIDVSLDGARIVTGDTAGQVALWSALDGELLHEPWQVEHRVTALHFDPSGQRIAIGSLGCNVRVLELGDGTVRHLNPGQKIGTGHNVGASDDVRFDFSGHQLIAVSGDCNPSVMAWEISTGVLTWEREVPWAGPPARQSADGKRWLFGGRGVWLDAGNGSTLATAFPTGNFGLETNGDVAWRMEGPQVRLFTLGDPVRIRDVRLDP